MTPEEIKLLTTALKTLARQEKIIGVMAQLLSDHTLFIVSLLPQCQANECSLPACKIHSILDIRMCDDHMITTITKAQMSLLDFQDEDMSTVKEAIAREEMWVDLPNAMYIRSVSKHYRLSISTGAIKLTQSGSFN